MEAAASAVAENRSDPMWLWLVVVNFIVSTHNRATEPVHWSPSSRWKICLAELSHGGYWSCYKVRAHSARKERTEKPTNEPRDDIFSQMDVLLGCCHCCRRSCVLVDHENCRCPKIFLLLLLRPPKLHVQWSSTFSIFQTVYLAVKKVVFGLEVPPRGDFHTARGRTVLIPAP